VSATRRAVSRGSITRPLVAASTGKEPTPVAAAKRLLTEVTDGCDLNW